MAGRRDLPDAILLGKVRELQTGRHLRTLRQAVARRDGTAAELARLTAKVAALTGEILAHREGLAATPAEAACHILLIRRTEQALRETHRLCAEAGEAHEEAVRAHAEALRAVERARLRADGIGERIARLKVVAARATEERTAKAQEEEQGARGRSAHGAA